MSRRSRRALARIVPALCCVILVTTAAAKRPARYEFVPDTAADGAPVLDGDTWWVSDGAFELRLRRLDVGQRREYLRQRTGSETDPFAGRPGEPEPFVSFVLELRNRGGDKLAIEPQNCWLVSHPLGIEYPLDRTTIRTSFSVLEREMPAAYEAAITALLDGLQVLEPGEAVSGLLVYRRPHERMRRFAVELQLTLPSGDVARVKAPYRRQKLKRR